MELEEVVTKLINHIDNSLANTEDKIINIMERRLKETKTETIQEVNVLLEQQRSQFNTFGEGLDTLRDQMNRSFEEVDQRFEEVGRRFDKVDQKLDRNDSEHHQFKLMIQELAADQKEIKQKVTDLDQEFETKIRRVK
jgi:septation ring formation regulator EzrA